MARIFLLNPPTPEPIRSPLLAFCYLAAGLERAGHDVALLDASAPLAPRTLDAIVAEVARFEPHLVGLHCKTLYVQETYRVLSQLAERWPVVVGGPHATVRPLEPLDHGARYVLEGEADRSLPALCDALDGRGRLSEIEGLVYSDGEGAVRLGPRRRLLDELDALPDPLSVVHLFDPTWYGATTPQPPVGLLSSRGCPAACTFCSNEVTGRRFRWHSGARVASEVRAQRDRFGRSAFSFFDDSFAVGRRRIRELSSALREEIARAGPLYWTCTAHPAHLDRETLVELKSAGLSGVDLGMESADPAMLIRIGKGVTVGRVLEVLTWCRELGIHSVVNLMFGWPDETDEELEATCQFLERAAPLVGGFNARGVVVPYPGTALYEAHHRTFGFTDWWLREPPLDYLPFPLSWDEAEIRRAYAHDPALDRNFFRHPPHRLDKIRAALWRKAECTIRAVRGGAVADTAARHGVPAAGAR